MLAGIARAGVRRRMHSGRPRATRQGSIRQPSRRAKRPGHQGTGRPSERHLVGSGASRSARPAHRCAARADRDARGGEPWSVPVSGAGSWPWLVSLAFPGGEDGARNSSRTVGLVISMERKPAGTGAIGFACLSRAWAGRPSSLPGFLDDPGTVMTRQPSRARRKPEDYRARSTSRSSSTSMRAAIGLRRSRRPENRLRRRVILAIIHGAPRLPVGGHPKGSISPRALDAGAVAPASAPPLFFLPVDHAPWRPPSGRSQARRRDGAGGGCFAMPGTRQNANDWPCPRRQLVRIREFAGLDRHVDGRAIQSACPLDFAQAHEAK